jgi:hypothetical protein
MTRAPYPLLLAVLIIILLAPLVLHPDHLLYPRDGEITDLTVAHWPAVAYNASSLQQHGQVPLWRTTIASGGPWAANPQSWLWYPPAWLFFAPGVPINLTFNLLLLAHLLLAALATYALGRRALDLSPVASALAGLAFALAPWVSAQLAAGHINVVLALAWLPLALLGGHHVATTGRSGGAVLAGVAWAAALLNHFQMAAFGAGLTVAWTFLFLWPLRTAGARPDPPDNLQPRPRGSRWRALGLLLAMPAIALLLSAALLVPLAEALPYLNRGTLTLDEAGIFSLPWPHLLTAVIPTYGGEPEQAIYLGLPLALLALVALALKRDRVTWFWAILGLVAVLFALGTHGPLYPLLFRLVPGLSWLRVPPRAWALVALGLALLAGRGLDALARPTWSAPARRRVTTLAMVALVAGLVLAAGLALLYRPVPPGVWILAILTTLTTAALLLRARLLLPPTPTALALLLVTAVDLGLARTAWIKMRSPADAFAWGAETAGFLAEQPGQFRSYSPSYSLPQHTAFQHGLSLADGLDPFQLVHYAQFLALAGGFAPGGYSVTQPPRLYDPTALPDATRLGLLNVGFVAADFPIEAEGLSLQARLNETYIYENERWLPRAFTVAQPQTPDPVTLRQPIEANPARIAVYTPNRIVVAADMAEPGLLVLSEVWYPGWRALDNGVEAGIQQVDGVLRGVYLQAGSHTVEFRYAPWTVWLGLAVSGATALGLLAFAASRMWKRT